MRIRLINTLIWGCVKRIYFRPTPQHYGDLKLTTLLHLLAKWSFSPPIKQLLGGERPLWCGTHRPTTFGIQQSLSMKRCPYDNAMAQAMFKVFKTEFANQSHFISLEHGDHIHQFNNLRIRNTRLFNTCGIQAETIIIFVQFIVDIAIYMLNF